MQLNQETIITEQREEIAKLKAEIKELKKKYLKEILHSCKLYKEYVYKTLDDRGSRNVRL